MKFEEKIKDHEARKRVARAMGGADKLAKRAKPGVLNARERIDRPVPRAPAITDARVDGRAADARAESRAACRPAG